MSVEISIDEFPSGLVPTDEEITSVVDEARRDVRYVVTDYPVELLVQKFKEDPKEEGDIFIPDYQRRLRWPERNQSYFIESLILRVPLPPIFLYDVKGRLEIVDGSQRVRTLARFVAGDFALDELEKLDILNGLHYTQLPPAIQKRFLNTPVRSFVLDEGTDESTRIELFRRLNTTGKRLHDAEIRKGAYRGKFLDLILECANSAAFRALTPKISKASDPDSERQELVTRFLVYADHYQEFTHDVRRFLDNHVISKNKTVSDTELGRMKKEFFNTMKFIQQHYPHAFYRTPKGGTLPRVRFEAVAVGSCLALRERSNLIPTDVSWMWEAALNKLVRTDASNSGPRLRERIEYVRNHLLND